jgi:hypothetical protein
MRYENSQRKQRKCVPNYDTVCTLVYAETYNVYYLNIENGFSAFGSNLGPQTSYFYGVFPGFSQSFQANSGIVSEK